MHSRAQLLRRDLDGAPRVLSPSRWQGAPQLQPSPQSDLAAPVLVLEVDETGLGVVGAQDTLAIGQELGKGLGGSDRVPAPAAPRRAAMVSRVPKTLRWSGPSARAWSATILPSS